MNPGLAFLAMFGVALIIVIIMIRAGIMEISILGEDGELLDLEGLKKMKPDSVRKWVAKGIGIIAKKLEPKKEEDSAKDIDDEPDSDQ